MTRDIMFHGAKRRHDKLKGHTPPYRGSLGYGLYLTTEESFASVFGKYIHEVVSPVPDELVAGIEPHSYDCGNDMQLYTPGSLPFSFRLRDRNTGEDHLYSVLGDCEEQVKTDLRLYALGEYAPSDSLRERAASARGSARTAAGSLWNRAISDVNDASSRRHGRDVVDVIEDVLSDWLDDEPDSDDYATVESILSDTAREVDAFVAARVEATLGEEIDMDELSTTCERLGYSAFYISGYAPGDEYVIFDDAYLPLKVIRVR